MGGQLGSGEYLNIRDMIDGGGAGRSGQEFKGGGILSALANAIAEPLGSRSRQQQMQATRPVERPQMPFRPQPVASTAGPQSAVIPSPTPVSEAPLDPMQYGPPARPLVGQNLKDAMNPPRAAPVGNPDDLLRRFEGQVMMTPGGRDLIGKMDQDPELAERLLLEWIRNGYQMPGA